MKSVRLRHEEGENNPPRGDVIACHERVVLPSIQGTVAPHSQTYEHKENVIFT